MNTTLCLSIRFIHPVPLFHGSRDSGEPEWPPSPMRVFQALLNAACLRARGRPLPPEVRSAFHILEVIHPHLVAPNATVSTIGHRAYVPHNQADLVAMARYRGGDESQKAFRELVGECRTDKDHRPMRIEFVGDDLPTLHYLYRLADTNADPHVLLESLRPSVRSIYSLGWGIDQVVADVTLIDDALTSTLVGQHYSPSARGGRPLRTPRQGSLDALHSRHDRFLNRLTGSDWTPVPPLTAMDVVRYRQADEPLSRPHILFRLLDDNRETARYPHAKLVHIAGMVQHLAIEALRGKAPRGVVKRDEWLNRFVRGKGDNAETPHEKISFIPLPSIGFVHSDAMIRNVLLVAPVGCEDQLEFVARYIDGKSLTPKAPKDAPQDESCEADGTPVDFNATIERFTPPARKFIETCYLCPEGSRVWESVTPVILDGHNDKKDSKTIKLIQSALQRAGIETPCAFTWQSMPFIRNGLSAHKYRLDPTAPEGKRPAGYHFPKHLKDRTVVHLRLTFDHPIPGPLTIGAGRHCGFGLMSAGNE
jgi:CRISPR-associated protein Csb2